MAFDSSSWQREAVGKWDFHVHVQRAGEIRAVVEGADTRPGKGSPAPALLLSWGAVPGASGPWAPSSSALPRLTCPVGERSTI